MLTYSVTQSIGLFSCIRMVLVRMMIDGDDGFGQIDQADDDDDDHDDDGCGQDPTKDEERRRRRRERNKVAAEKCR